MNKKCQVFTPRDYIEKLLDSLDYKHNLYGKRILENSCGDGNILSVVVQRYINDCRKQRLTRTKIRNGLKRDICGVEIDPEQYHKCIKKLNLIIANNGILPVNWNIFNEDYLKRNDETKYDFIVGNPPYITYSEMKKNEQVFLKKEFESCQKGKFDYCYAFIEKSIKSLTNKGKMSYLIPSSVFKTVFGEKLREIMLPYLTEIKDYTQIKVFKKALVKSAIIVIDKNNNNNKVHYIDETISTNKLIKRDSLGEKWIFSNKKNGTKRFGDYFRVSHVVATLLNKAFVLKTNDYIEKKGYYICGNSIIEKDMVRETATPRGCKYNSNEKIIFPYLYDENHKLIRFKENDFKRLYPGTYNYLLKNKENLEQRNSDYSSSWFEYGRSQALASLDCEKYLMSTIISSEVQLYKLSRECIPYGGMFIVPKEGNKEITLEEGVNLLRNYSFYEYALNIGIHINGKSVRITSKDIENYMF